MFVEDMDIEGADVEHSVSLAVLLQCVLPLQPVNLVWKFVYLGERRKPGAALRHASGPGTAALQRQQSLVGCA